MKIILRNIGVVTCTLLSLAWFSACAQQPEAAVGTPAPFAAGPVPASSHAASAGGQATSAVEPLPPSVGTFTVAKVVEDRMALAGKTVTISGKVVKFNGGILDLNWLHIQDGSGAAEAGTNDLTVTSTGVAGVGDVVTITGKVVVDKDFGAGYSYAVLLQNASVSVK